MQLKKNFLSRINLAFLLFSLGMLYLHIQSEQNSFLFHFLAEFLTIVISGCLFAVIWILRGQDREWFLQHFCNRASFHSIL